jgi:hypothetical protein
VACSAPFLMLIQTGNSFGIASGVGGMQTNTYTAPYTSGNTVYFSQPQQYPIAAAYSTGPIVPLEDKPLSATFIPASSYTAGVEILFRNGRERVKSCVIKGITDVDVAEEMFLAQFTDEEQEKPEIVAAVEVLIN